MVKIPLLSAVGDFWRASLLTVPVVFIAGLDKERLRAVMTLSVVLVLLISSGIFLYEYHLRGLPWLESMQGLYGTGHRNVVAAVFAFGLVYAMVGALLDIGHRRQLVLMLLAVVIFLAMGCVNNSRGALMGMLVAIPVVCLRAYPRQAIVGVAALMLVLFLGFQMGAGKRAMEHNGSIDNGRDKIWAAFIDRAEQSPWIGYGGRSYAIDPELRRQHPEIAPLYYPHSIYIDLFYSSGILGVIFWLGWFAWVAVRSNRYLQASNTAVVGLGGGALAYMMVHGLVDHTFYSFSVVGVLIVGATLFSARLAPLKPPVAAAG